ncbi:unnamed protein product [Adineta ricciae]|uniref:SCP domain-containing protein n=1 Tax=Adineta ricciae TaxID=249248 RepID=A0A813QEQ1_ADIRI|nr:unnamed protein product [Adineta ricciae]
MLFIYVITFLLLIIQVHTTSQNINPSPYFAPSIPVHNDTSHDDEGKDHDSEPLKNNGRGSHEASAQNYAAENNATHGVPIDDFQQMILADHNKCRRQTCASDLQEDDELHREAMKRAHSLANGHMLPLPDDYNENVFELDTGDPSKVTSEMIVNGWCNEGKHYDAGKEESSLQYSQLVWKSSKKLGVGHAYDSHKLYVIVLYKPSGNLRGEFGANVGCGVQDKQKKNE